MPQWPDSTPDKYVPRLQAAGLAQIRHVAATPTDLLHLLVGGLAPALKAHADTVSLEAFGWWFLIHAILSAIFCAAARGHPYSIATASLSSRSGT